MSNDLISRHEVLEVLKEVFEKNAVPFDKEGVLRFSKAVPDAIRNLPTAYDDKVMQQLEERKKSEYRSGKWIPCSERMPEESLNAVIGWDKYRKRCCFVQYYDGKWHLGNSYDSVKIIAWMPVPRPYREEVQDV